MLSILILCLAVAAVFGLLERDGNDCGEGGVDKPPCFVSDLDRK
jgi:hypothetical protein